MLTSLQSNFFSHYYNLLLSASPMPKLYYFILVSYICIWVHLLKFPIWSVSKTHTHIHLPTHENATTCACDISLLICRIHSNDWFRAADEPNRSSVYFKLSTEIWNNQAKHRYFILYFYYFTNNQCSQQPNSCKK